MKNSRTILTVLLLSWICAGTATGQDISELPEKKNALSVSLVPAFYRGVSISYARKLRNGYELIINPKVTSGFPKASSEPGQSEGSNRILFFTVPDPQWFYDHYQLRVGIRKPLGIHFSYEPQVQLAYGKFYNKVLKTDDPEGDAFDKYVRLDRVYYSAGLINNLSWVNDFNALRIKFFTGAGIHARFYEETQYNHYLWYRQVDLAGPSNSSYFKARVTLHAGIEFGLRF